MSVLWPPSQNRLSGGTAPAGARWYRERPSNPGSCRHPGSRRRVWSGSVVCDLTSPSHQYYCHDECFLRDYRRPERRPQPKAVIPVHHRHEAMSRYARARASWCGRLPCGRQAGEDSTQLHTPGGQTHVDELPKFGILLKQLPRDHRGDERPGGKTTTPLAWRGWLLRQAAMNELDCVFEHLRMRLTACKPPAEPPSEALGQDGLSVLGSAEHRDAARASHEQKRNFQIDLDLLEMFLLSPRMGGIIVAVGKFKQDRIKRGLHQIPDLVLRILGAEPC